MDEDKIKYRGPGWLVLRGSSSRKAVLRRGTAIIGPSFTKPRFTILFAREEQLGEHLAKRFEVTANKLMHAISQAYVEGAEHPSLYIEGAKLQHGTGTSEYVRGSDGRSYLTGVEAAHVGIGTVTQQGEAVSLRGYRKLFETANQHGVLRHDVPLSFPAAGHLTSLGLVYDAETYFAPAFVNKASGLFETEAMRVMRAILPSHIPSTQHELTKFIHSYGLRMFELLLYQQRTILRPVKDRLRKLQNAGFAGEILQDPHDTNNLMFDGREHQFEEAIVAEMESDGSELHQLAEQKAAAIGDRAEELAQVAEAAREEFASGGTSGDG